MDDYKNDVRLNKYKATNNMGYMLVISNKLLTTAINVENLFIKSYSKTTFGSGQKGICLLFRHVLNKCCVLNSLLMSKSLIDNSLQVECVSALLRVTFESLVNFYFALCDSQVVWRRGKQYYFSGYQSIVNEVWKRYHFEHSNVDRNSIVLEISQEDALRYNKFRQLYHGSFPKTKECHSKSKNYSSGGYSLYADVLKPDVNNKWFFEVYPLDNWSWFNDNIDKNGHVIVCNSFIDLCKRLNFSADYLNIYLPANSNIHSDADFMSPSIRMTNYGLDFAYRPYCSGIYWRIEQLLFDCLSKLCLLNFFNRDKCNKLLENLSKDPLFCEYDG